MLAVCDTTPINYLIQIGHVDLVPALYGKVYIPVPVLAELSHPVAPVAVRSWAQALPDWVGVEDAVRVEDPLLLSLDEGERQAIALVGRLKADLVLTDDYRARVAAHRLGIATSTTLLTLDAAAERGCISFGEALGRLLENQFPRQQGYPFRFAEEALLTEGLWLHQDGS